MRYTIMALACAGALFTTAAYADDLMANTYGNTVTTKSHKTGSTGSLMFASDGTYTANAMGADGKPVAYTGAWTTKDGGNTICLAPKLPAGSPGSAPSWSRPPRRSARTSPRSCTASAPSGKSTR